MTVFDRPLSTRSSRVTPTHPCESFVFLSYPPFNFSYQSRVLLIELAHGFIDAFARVYVIVRKIRLCFAFRRQNFHQRPIFISVSVYFFFCLSFCFFCLSFCIFDLDGGKQISYSFNLIHSFSFCRFLAIRILLDHFQEIKRQQVTPPATSVSRLDAPLQVYTRGGGKMQKSHSLK